MEPQVSRTKKLQMNHNSREKDLTESVGLYLSQLYQQWRSFRV
jgi:hypothetical protein